MHAAVYVQSCCTAANPSFPVLPLSPMDSYAELFGVVLCRRGVLVISYQTVLQSERVPCHRGYRHNYFVFVYVAVSRNFSGFMGRMLVRKRASSMLLVPHPRPFPSFLFYTTAAARDSHLLPLPPAQPVGGYLCFVSGRLSKSSLRHGRAAGWLGKNDSPGQLEVGALRAARVPVPCP